MKTLEIINNNQSHNKHECMETTKTNKQTTAQN